MTSSRGLAMRSSAMPLSRSINCSLISVTAAPMPATDWSGTYSGSDAPSTTLVARRMNCSCSRGTPSMLSMMRSGSSVAKDETKSHSPVRGISSRISAVVSSARPRSSASMRGLKPRETILRSRMCSGSSMSMIEPRYSRISAVWSKIWVPSPEANSSGLRLMSVTSRCEPTAQNPAHAGSRVGWCGRTPGRPRRAAAGRARSGRQDVPATTAGR